MKKVIVLFGLFLLVVAPNAHATLSNFQTFTAEGAGLSIDAVGLQNNTDGTVQAEIPVGAVIEGAFLYSAAVGYSGNALYDVVFEGTTLASSASSRLDVGSKEANNWVAENRWDVTSIVQTKVGGGSGTFDFTVNETGFLDGEILVVLYKIPSAPVQTAFIFDGELATTGDTFNVNLTDGWDGTNAIFSLGISYGFQDATATGQYSVVDVNGSRLTSSAGGENDGYSANGGLITAGGIGDSIANPADPNALPNSFGDDDELYNLASFMTVGDNLVAINTLNPSNDDNIFFAGLVVNGKATVNGVPEPGTLLLLGVGLLGLASGARRKFMK